MSHSFESRYSLWRGGAKGVSVSGLSFELPAFLVGRGLVVADPHVHLALAPISVGVHHHGIPHVGKGVGFIFGN